MSGEETTFKFDSYSLSFFKLKGKVYIIIIIRKFLRLIDVGVLKEKNPLNPQVTIFEEKKKMTTKTVTGCNIRLVSFYTQ